MRRAAIEPRGVIGADDQLAVRDDLAIPGQDDEVVGLEGVEVGLVVAGAEGDGGARFGRPQGAHLAQGELHGAAGVAGLVHDEHAAAPDGGGRPRDEHRQLAGIGPAHHHGNELAL
jgi:hypothetical protein